MMADVNSSKDMNSKYTLIWFENIYYNNEK